MRGHDNQVVTLINTFAVKPGQQDALVRVLSDATDKVMRHIDGFVSANMHKSLDGKSVANYAQWREPILYTVSAIHELAG